MKLNPSLERKYLWSRKESDTTEQLTQPEYYHIIGEKIKAQRTSDFSHGEVGD